MIQNFHRTQKGLHLYNLNNLYRHNSFSLMIYRLIVNFLEELSIPSGNYSQLIWKNLHLFCKANLTCFEFLGKTNFSLKNYLSVYLLIHRKTCKFLKGMPYFNYLKNFLGFLIILINHYDHLILRFPLDNSIFFHYTFYRLHPFPPW